MAHIHEKIDWTVGAYIVYKNTVLLRLHEKYNVWVHVGGHVELDEDPVTAVIRECKEEVGLDIEVFDPSEIPPALNPGNKHLANPMHMNMHYVGGTEHQHVDLIYYARSLTDAVVPEKPDDKWEWLTKEAVEANTVIVPQIKFYALSALSVLGEK